MLGLAHSATSGATMYASMPGYCDTSQLTLEADDISGIQSLYPASSSSSQPPAAPSQLAVAANSANPSSSLALSWVDNATNESGYRVERSTDGSSFGQVAQLGVGAKSFTDSGLAAATPYYYRVSAFNTYGSSGYSNAASGQTQASSLNTAPTVSIANPSNNSSYPYGAAITFSGSATDTQDGNLTSSLKWTSNLDGQIGTGGSFSRTLSSGTHVITATVTDAGGLVGSRQVSLTVAAAAAPPAPTVGPTLTARGYKVKGAEMVDLSWSGLSSTSVDIYRNGSIVSTSANDGAQTDKLTTKGAGSFSYKACAAGTSTCTNSVSVSF